MSDNILNLPNAAGTSRVDSVLENLADRREHFAGLRRTAYRDRYQGVGDIYSRGFSTSGGGMSFNLLGTVEIADGSFGEKMPSCRLWGSLTSGLRRFPGPMAIS